MRILITGSNGLIGGEATEYFDRAGHDVVGIDNNMRAEFFGPEGDTLANRARIYHHRTGPLQLENADVRDYSALEAVFQRHGPFDAVIHCAAQPSHDKARDIPLVDFAVNATGTLNMLELTRLYCPNPVFIFMSTNKVYGDRPNFVELCEYDTRIDLVSAKVPFDGYSWQGFNEDLSIDQSTHSVFGASKVAADVMVQEYGRCYGMRTVCLRGGCLTGPNHAGVPLHGFLQYLARCVVLGLPYTVHGYEGKQVRDNIHSADVAKVFELLIHDPPPPGTVYNLGGGRGNEISMLEAIEQLTRIVGKPLKWDYQPTSRQGDHICWVTDMAKFRKTYPDWTITKPLDRILWELVGGCQRGVTTERYVPGDGGDSYFEAYAGALLPFCRGRVLDIGCGHGVLTARIARKPGVTGVTGTDKIPTSTCYECPPGTTFAMCSTEQLIETLYFRQPDTIISTEHIEHLEPEIQDRLLAWVAQNLAPEGVFLGSMPTPDDPANPDPYHRRTFTGEEWLARLREHFEIAQVWSPGPGCYCWRASTPYLTGP